MPKPSLDHIFREFTASCHFVKTLLLRYFQALRRHAVLTGVLLAGAILFTVLAVGGSDSWEQAVQKRESKGRVVRPIDFMKTGLWQTAGLEAVLFLGLALTTPLWARRGSPDSLAEGDWPSLQKPATDAALPRIVFWLGLLLIVALGLGLRALRMDLSIYNDEEHTLRTYTRGNFPRLTLETMLEYERAQDGLPFKRDGWEWTFWSTTNGPNHVLFSILSRASLNTWNFLRGQPENTFSDTVFRLPSLLGSLGMILFLGLLVYRETGQASSGWAVALLAATHPWLIRYGTEGRGYGLMLFFCVLLWWFALGGLRRPGWGNWIGFGIAQWGILNSYIGSVYVPLVLNATLLPLMLWPLWQACRRREDLLASWHWRRFTRWVAANFLTIALYLPMILPLVPQYRAYFATEFASAPTPPGWFQDFAAYSLAGMPWETPDGTNLPSILQGIAWGEPFALAAIVAIVVLALAGTGLLLARRGSLLWLLPTFVLAPVIGYFHNIAGGRILYVWYLIFVVPGVLVLAAVGMSPRLWGRGLFPRQPWLKWAVPILISGLIGVGCYLPKAWFLHHRPKENMEEAVQLAGRPIDPTGKTRSASIHLACWTNDPFYDPWAITVVGPETLEDAIGYALEHHRELELTFAHRPLIEQYQPDVLELLEDHGLFYPATDLPGLEEKQFDIHITQLRPLDPNKITRSYHLSAVQYIKLGDVSMAGLQKRGLVFGPGADLKYLPETGVLIMRNAWPEHIKLRKELSGMK